MKIIYLDSGRMPTEKAHGYQIMKMCEAFSELGHEVLLLVSSRKNLIGADPFEYYGVQRNFRIKRLWSVDVVNILPKYGSWISRTSFLLVAKIYLHFRKYHLLYIREHMSGLFFRNFLMEVHTLPSPIRTSDVRIWQKAKKLVVLTSYLKTALEKQGIAADKILVAGDAVDAEKFSAQGGSASGRKINVREELGLPTDKKIVMYTGNFFSWKGVYSLAEASKFLNDDMLVVFVGGSPFELGNFKNYLEKRQIPAGRIKLEGHLNRAKIPKYLAAADVLVLPNSGKTEISRYHTSPMKLFEYMAAGQPIVASDLPSIREVLNETNSLLVSPDDSTALAEGIKRVLNDPELSSKIARQAETQVQEYTWPKRAKKIISCLT